jgi:hypothetical protein
MKAFISIMFLLLTRLLLVSCDDYKIPYREETVEVSQIITRNGKTFLEVEGKPFPIFGAQIRLDALLNCDQKGIHEIEPYFSSAKDLGLNSVQIPFWWKLIEPKENQFSFEVVDIILMLANKYDLKLEVLWFSTNMVGDSFSYLVPTYILANSEKHLERNDKGSFWNYYGYQYSLILDDKWILENETKALRALMTHIAKWDRLNNSKHPVISVQIHNESDAFSRWRYDQKNIHYADGREFSDEDAWEMTLNALNAVGKAVQKSPYKVATRTNIITNEGLKDFPEVSNANPKDVFDLEGIDFVSYDPYTSSVLDIKENTIAFKSLEGNYPLIAENKGVYENSASLILTAAALGSGYNIYDLATSKFFIDHTTPNFVDQIDHGVYTWDLEPKSHTSEVKSILKGLTAASQVVALVSSSDFAAFNVNQDFPLEETEQTISTKSVEFNFYTNEGAIGFAITMDDFLLVYVTKRSTIELAKGNFSEAEFGYFERRGDFVSEGEVELIEGVKLEAEGERLYRIKYTSDSEIESTTLDFIGG